MAHIAHPTGVIEGSQEIVVGEQVLLSVDFTEVSAQSFTVASATFELNEKGVSTPIVAATAAVVATGLNGSIRVQYLLDASISDSLVADKQHHIIWNLTLGDTQSRKLKEPVRVVTI